MAIDIQANDRFKAENTKVFKSGTVVLVCGVQFTIVSNQGNQLVLKPVAASIS